MTPETVTSTPEPMRSAQKTLPSVPAPAPAPPKPSLTLDGLAALTPTDLAALYADGAAPEHMQQLDGDLTGRMLVVRTLDTPRRAGAVAAIAKHWAFPWGGKSFTAAGPYRGHGINRVRLFGQHRLFPFTTHVAPSLIDERPCVILDYDHAENPAWIRVIHDEVRAVAPDLFLGPACIKRGGSTPPTHVLWFALAVGLPARGGVVRSHAPSPSPPIPPATPTARSISAS